MTLALPSRRLAPAWVRNDLWRRARAVPSLDLRFAENKSLVDAISGQNLITFTRSSNGTYVDSAGVLRTATTNEPRFDHNPITGESLGLPVDEQRTNLLLRSEEFETGWTFFRLLAFGSGSSTNAAAAPTGQNTADLLIESTETGVHAVAQTVTVQNGASYTASVYVKSLGARNISLNMNTGSTRRVVFDLSTGSVGAADAGITGNIVNAGGGWYRCSATASAASTSLIFYVELRNPATGISYAGDGTSGIYIWGAQLEAGAFPTSYIPTTGSAATRNADVADIVQQALAAGIRTLYAEFRSPASGTRGVVSLNDNTANERAAINTSGTDPRMVVVDGGATQADIDAGTIAANARSRMAVRIAADNFAASFNGGAVVTDTSGTLPTVDRLFIGRTQAGEYLNAPIARLVGWREELPDSALQALTQ